MVIAGRSLTREALHNDVGAQPTQYLYEQIQVLLNRPETKPLGVLVPLARQRRAAKELQLVKFYLTKMFQQM